MTVNSSSLAAQDRPAPPDFTPVPRKPRHDGWTPERQRVFIAALADTGSVSRAARWVNMSPEGAYYLRRQPGSEGFRRAWEAALDFGVQRLKDIAYERAIIVYPERLPWQAVEGASSRRCSSRASSGASAASATTAC